MEQHMLRTPHVVLLASPGMGHLIPIAELAKHLVIQHNLTATVITFSGFISSQTPQQLSLLSSLPAGITSLPLPHIPLDDLPPDARTKTPISSTIARSRPLLRDILRALKSSSAGDVALAAFVVDNLGLAALPVAKEVGVPGLLLFTSCFTMLSVEFHLPRLIDQIICDHPGPISLPGCAQTIRGRDLPEPIRNRSHPGHRFAIHHSELYKEAAAILVNSFEALEPGPADAFRSSGSPPVYPIGPLVRHSSEVAAERQLRWLDRQPQGSVLFVSFGSAGAVSRAQAREIALGLEMSETRFLWVLRVAGEADQEGSPLPEGFAERTGEKVGMVVDDGWAPQTSVLAHVATGGFLSHCGWNSVLESLVNGVAIAAWPLQHEQPMNAEMLVDQLRVAVRVRMCGEGTLVGREEVCRVVRELMEGEEGKQARARAGEIKAAAAQAVGDEGSSTKAFADLLRLLRSAIN